jgi:cytochrome c oxidase subunit 4
MDQPKEKEISVLNMLLALLAVGSIAVAGWTVATTQFKGGIDDLFLILVCLMLALLFAINPVIWAYERGLLKHPFKIEGDADAGAVAELDHGHGGSNRENVVVWGGLLLLTAIEVFLAYIHINQTLMLIILMLLSIVKAALIVAYFMHMKFEKLSFILTVVPVLVVLLCLFGIFFPDSNRIDELRPYKSPTSAGQTE